MQPSRQEGSISPELVAAVRREIEGASSVLIGTHLNPDGDALGSALAMSHYLDQIGVQNEVVCHHVPPRNLRFLPGVDRLRQQPKEEKHDLGILLDLDSSDRLGNTAPYFAPCERVIVIDHHVPHEAPGDLRVIDTSAPATAVILYRLLRDLDAAITPAMATCLLAGIVTDTGSFRFRNTTPESMVISAALLDLGGDLTAVSEEIFQSKSLASVRLLGRMLEAMRLESNDQIAWSALTIQDFEEAHARDEDTEGFVNEMLFITSVQISALLREPKAGKIRCSLRSRGEFDVASVARAFGGGGHVNAAGCTFDLPMAEAQSLLVEKLKTCLGSS